MGNPFDIRFRRQQPLPFGAPFDIAPRTSATAEGLFMDEFPPALSSQTSAGAEGLFADLPPLRSDTTGEPLPPVERNTFGDPFQEAINAALRQLTIQAMQKMLEQKRVGEGTVEKKQKKKGGKKE